MGRIPRSRLVIILTCSFLIIMVFLLFFAVCLINRNNNAGKSPVMTGKELAERDANQLKAATELMTQVYGNTKIDFYGKVVDEEDKPISGASILIKIESLDSSLGALLGSIAAGEANYKKDVKTIYSNEEGEFKIENESGVFLDLEVKKPGYIYASGTKNNLAYPKAYNDHYMPDKNKPEIYKLWKEDKTEEVIWRNKSYYQPHDKDIALIDLVRGKITDNEADADIRVIIKAPPGISAYDKYYNWSCSIESIDGGIVETDDEQFCSAPSEGYMPSSMCQINADEKNKWKNKVVKSYYFKSRKSKVHGGIKVEYEPAFGYNPPVERRMRINSIVNPNGSRVLVYNPEKAIRNPDKFYKENFSKNIKDEK